MIRETPVFGRGHKQRERYGPRDSPSLVFELFRRTFTTRPLTEKEDVDGVHRTRWWDGSSERKWKRNY